MPHACLLLVSASNLPVELLDSHGCSCPITPIAAELDGTLAESSVGGAIRIVRSLAASNNDTSPVLRLDSVIALSGVFWKAWQLVRWDVDAVSTQRPDALLLHLQHLCSKFPGVCHVLGLVCLPTASRVGCIIWRAWQLTHLNISALASTCLREAL